VVALMQKDVKRMMAYSSINHAGFILLGVEAATTRGVSAALYYLFAYTFLTIGSFAVITVMGRDGDTGHTITDYRGLARRQPVLALAFAVLLLGQAGVPFTTGFLAKFGVVGAVVATHAYALAAIAMVTAAIAVFFYLRVAVAMYSPVGAVADPVDEMDSGDETARTGAGSPPGSPGSGSGAVAVDAEPDAVAGESGPTGAVTSLSVLTDAPPTDEVIERGAVTVPLLTWVALGLCVAFTVVFGIIPEPILNFAHQATLLFT